MSTKTSLHDDLIRDITGQVLHPESAVLLKAIDQLMTVGTYYSPEHDQYHVASRKACAAICESIGDRPSVILEITSTGLMIADQVVDPQQRTARQLHDLLVPLNIARLEIDRDLTPEHLRTALRALHDHRLLVGSRTSFQEITIEGLPPTVRTLSASLISCAPGEVDAESAGKALADLLAEGQAGRPATSEELTRKFLDLVERIVRNLDLHRTGSGEIAAGGGSGQGGGDLRSLAQSLRELVKTDPDPKNLLGLIQNAQKALALSADPSSVDLVFRILRKELASRGQPPLRKAGAPHPGSIEQDFDLQAFRTALAEIVHRSEQSGPLDHPLKQDYLGICFKIMGSDPPDSLKIHLTAAIEQALGDPGLEDDCAELCAQGLAMVIDKGRNQLADHLFPAVCGPLREAHPDQLFLFWRKLWGLLETEGRSLVWPFLVDDALLGMGEISPENAQEIVAALGSQDIEAAGRHREKLFGMPAFRQKSAAGTIFSVPPAKMAALHTLLLESPLADWHGPRLHRVLAKQPASQITGVVMHLLGDYQPENRAFYAALIRQQAEGAMPADLRTWIVELLVPGLRTLPPGRRREDWVVHALSWLGKLDHAAAADLFDCVLNERRLFFFRAWPAECRTAAERMVSSWNSASAT